jgi:tRNA pseudouridine65 synthase
MHASLSFLLLMSPLHLIHLDEHLVAIDKPAGLLVHRSALDAQEQRFALQMLRDQLGATVWPVHRLDKGTSGVLLFALNPAVAQLLAADFEHGRMRKRYIALVRGWPSEVSGSIDHPLARDPELPSQGQVLLEARTDWTRLACAEWPVACDSRFASTRVALLDLAPHNGRRHQLRRHLKHIAHPIIGDATHGKGPLNRSLAQFLGRQRLWLHAMELNFQHPVTSQALTLRAPLGKEWQALPGLPAL